VNASIAGGTGVAWQLAAHVLVRTWDGEIVAYNDETGHTHHFMEIAAWILEGISARAMTEGDVMAAAAAELEPPAEGELAASIRSSFALLQGLGLIEAVPAL
jgi:PqqD family protein of HPr-rel-A system